MSTYIDCPKCGSEFIVSDDISGSALRCPDCLQWIDDHYDLYGDLSMEISGYASRLGSDSMNELEYGYDY